MNVFDDLEREMAERDLATALERTANVLLRVAGVLEAILARMPLQGVTSPYQRPQEGTGILPCSDHNQTTSGL